MWVGCWFEDYAHGFAEGESDETGGDGTTAAVGCCGCCCGFVDSIAVVVGSNGSSSICGCSSCWLLISITPILSIGICWISPILLLR